MSCNKCKYAVNWDRPFNNNDNTSTVMGFTCINFDISGEYSNAYEKITFPKTIDLMIYEFPSNNCWVDGGSSIPKNGCINFKSIYEDSPKLKTRQLISLKSFISILENHCKLNKSDNIPIVFDEYCFDSYNGHTYIYYDFAENLPNYGSIYKILVRLQDSITFIKNKNKYELDKILNTTIVFRNNTIGQDIYVDLDFLQSFLIGKYEGYLTCNNSPNIKMSKEQIDAYLNKEYKLFLS